MSKCWQCNQALSGLNRGLGVRGVWVVVGAVALAIGVAINW
jgi:hypothetical protein